MVVCCTYFFVAQPPEIYLPVRIVNVVTVCSIGPPPGRQQSDDLSSHSTQVFVSACGRLPLGRQMLNKPLLRQTCNLFKRALFLEKVRGARHDLELFLRVEMS
jgi:hypothetical protein